MIEMIIIIPFAVLLILLITGCIFPRVGHAIFGLIHCDLSGYDCCSVTGTYKYCGEKCLQDSQGNWF